MDYTDWIWLKFWLVVGAAFVYGVWRGFTGQPLEPGSDGTDPASTAARHVKD